MKKFFITAALAAVALVSQSQAAVLSVNVSPLDLSYDSSTFVIHDATSIDGGIGDPSEADPLGAMTFSLIPGGFLGVLTTNIFADVFIQLDSALTIGSTSNVIGGYFDLLTSSTAPGYGTSIDLTGGTVEATAQGLILSIGDSTALTGIPGVAGNTLNLGSPLTITFSGQTGDFGGLAPEDFEGLVLGNFTSEGSADIRGEFVPEPSTYAMLGSALIGLGYLRRRKA